MEDRRVFAGLVLNELVVDTVGSDVGFEYVEIKGIPGQTLSNIYFVSVEGDSASQGIADLVIDLNGRTIGSNGLLIINAPGGGHPLIDPQTTVVAYPEGSSLENNSNSFVLVSSPTPIVQTTDYDVNTDGVLEFPAGSVILDAVGWTDGGANDIAYGAILTQVAGIPPGAATRFLHDNRVLEAAAWYSGDLAGADNTTTSYTATAANRSANFPSGGAITPGGINVPGDANIAPVGVADNYQVEPGQTLNVTAGSGVLSNDTDANGLNSILAAKLIAGPINATTFTLNPDGSFIYLSNGTPGLDSFTYQATDLNLLSATTTVSINVAASSNVGPTISVPAGPLNYTENGTPTVLASTGTIVDADSANFGSGSFTATISTNATADDLLEIRNQGSDPGQIGIAGSNVFFEGTLIGVASGGIGSTPLVVSLNNNATIAAAQALLRNITFQSNSDNPSTLQRTVQFVVNDGDGGPSLGNSNTGTTTINVTAVNDAPILVNGRTELTYAANGPAVTIDGALELSDPDSADFNGGVLTVAISANALAGDSLTIRPGASQSGQLTLSGNNVVIDGVTIGTFAGGDNVTPLTVTFNASANVLAVKSVARAITFSTTSPRLAPLARTVSMSVTDGDGGSSVTLNTTLTQSQVRRFGFQEGVDQGNGYYIGAADIQLAENQPNTPLPAGNNPTGEGLLVDFDGGTSNSQVLLRFDNMFGSGPGQIPVGASIVSARLVVNTLNGGDGATLHRVLTTWDANTETWNSFANGIAPRNAIGGVQNDGNEARIGFESQIGVANANSDPSANPTIIGVTADIRAWANGETNNGWLLRGWDGNSDGWGFLASEGANPFLRPKLEVEWLPAAIASTSFRQGENGYAGTNDTALTESTPTVNNAAGTTMFVDFNDAGGTNTSQVLLRFDGINGSGVSQVPSGALIHSAALHLASTVSNAQGDGGQFHTLLQPVDFATVTWDTFGTGAPTAGGGVTPDGIEASVVANTVAGNASRTPDAEAGFNVFDTTKDVQAWTNGTLVNHGWAVLPWANGTNGWAIESSESTQAANRPMLSVYFTPVGVTVTPTSGLTTTEAGGTATFSVVLNTPPTSDVTIGLTSSDTTEGSLTQSSLVFTPTNWDIPQIVTVTGVDDAAVDGNIAYQIVTAAAISTDTNYNGLAVPDVSLTNNDNDAGGVAPRVETVVFGDGTAQRSIITSLRVNFDSAMSIDPNAFQLEVSPIAGGGSFAPVTFTVNQAISLVAGKTVATLTFAGAGITGGSLPDGNYRLTALSSNIRGASSGLALDGDNNGSAGGNFVDGESAADNFFRLFGDSDGNGVVNPLETNRYRATVGKVLGDPAYNPLFDFDSSGGVTPADTNAYRQRVGRSRGF